eukprot:jgi/Phyca11/128368/e_gw1.75.10.1
MEEAIHANVSVIHNDAANSADEQATSERFSADIDDGRMSGDCDMGLDSVNVRSSAVLPPVCTIGEGAAHEIIDKILEAVMPRSDMPQRPVIPIKQGRSPLVEWFDNAKILAVVWFDSVSCTSIPRNVRNWRDDWQRAHEGKLARAFDIPAPNAAQDYDGFRAAAMKRVLSTNTHSHSSTCRKGVSGRRMCRLARPAGVFENETQPLLVQLTKASNPAKRVRATFAVCAINENVAGNIDVSPNYDMKRLLRKPTNGAVVWEQHRPQEDELFVETNLGFACLSRSHTNSSVINGRDAGDMVEEYQQAYMTKEKGGLKSATAVMATALQNIENSESSSDSEISDSEGGTLEERMEALIDRANERDSARFPGDATGRNGGARMYKVDGKILLVTQAESYRHRGEAFKEFSALEFEMIVDILPRHGTASEALSSYLIALVVPWGLDTGTPSVEMTADGLVSLCKGWNHSSARFIDQDAFEAFENSMLAELVAAAAAKDIETTAAVKAARSTFWSIVPPDAREAGGPHRGGGRTFHSAFKTFRKELSSNDLEILRLTFTERVGLIVVDEMSMFPSEFLALLNSRLRAIYRNNLPFGGRSIFLLDVTAGTPLCKVLYMTTNRDELLTARALFRSFTVFFLTEQHRAAGCKLLKTILRKYRVLPDFYPSGDKWTQDELARFRPMTAELLQSITTELNLSDVLDDPAWLDETTILVTSNMDRAVLTSCAAILYARRRQELVIKWRRRLKTEVPTSLKGLVFD